MSRKNLVMGGVLIGSIIGGYIPSFWGSGLLSFSSLIGNTIGALVGLFIAYKLTEGFE